MAAGIYIGIATFVFLTVLALQGLLFLYRNAPESDWLINVLYPVLVVFVFPLISFGVGHLVWRRLIRAANEREDQNRINQQQAAAQRALQRLVDENHKIGTDLKSEFVRAESALDRAEEDFAEGAISPFWERVEEALGALTQFHDGVRAIERNAKSYAEIRRSIAGHTVSASVEVDIVQDIGNTANRLARLVHNAHCSPYFAVVYEQRRTNALLTAGFNSLGDAVYAMGDRISQAVDDLSSTLQSLADHASSQSAEQSEVIGDRLAAIRIQLERDAMRRPGHHT